jgi:hypothetical protein
MELPAADSTRALSPLSFLESMRTPKHINVQSVSSPFAYPRTLLMSSCSVYGFFDIGPRRRGLEQPVPGFPPRPVLYGYYRSSISGTMQSLGSVNIRPPTPTWNDSLPDRAVVFVVGTIFAQTGHRASLIEAVHMDIVHGSPTRHTCRIAFPPSQVNAVGTVAGEHYFLSDFFLAVPITITQDVWDGVRTFELTYVCLFCSQFSSLLNWSTVASSHNEIALRATRTCRVLARS